MDFFVPYEGNVLKLQITLIHLISSHLNSYISYKIPDFLSKPLLYSKLALLFKPRLLYPIPLMYSKLVFLSKLIYIMENNQIFYPSRCCTQSSLFYPNLACFIQTLLMYSKLAVFSKLIYIMKTPIFFIQAIFVLKKHSSIQTSLALFKPS